MTKREFGQETTKERFLRLTVVAIVATGVLLLAVGTAGAISSCKTIDSPGTYQIDSDFNATGGTGCIEISGNSVTIDGNNKRITAQGSAQSYPAVSASGVSDITVKDLRLENFGTAVSFSNVDSSTVEDVSTSSGPFSSYGTANNGVKLVAGSDNNVVKDSFFDAPGQDGNTVGSRNGIEISDSEGNLILNNDIVEPANAGIRLYNANDNNITGNEVSGDPTGQRPPRFGIQIGGFGDGASNDNYVYDNDILGKSLFGFGDRGLSDGIYVSEGTGNELRLNKVRDVYETGILVDTSDTSVVSNSVLNNGEEGVRVFSGVTGVNLTDNTVSSSGQADVSPGVYVGADGTEVLRNTVRYGEGVGLLIDDASSTTVSNNRMEFNADWGIQVDSAFVAAKDLELATVADPIQASGSDFALSAGTAVGLELPTREQGIGAFLDADGSATLTLNYSDADISGLNESSISLWEKTGAWTDVGTGLDTANDTVSGTVAGGGSYTVAPLIGNQPPNAVLDAPASAAPGEDVTFDASGSNDTDGSIVEYRWDFDGDGTFDRNTSSATATHSYRSTGVFEAGVTVVDNGDDTDTANATISVSEQPVAKLNVSPSPTSVLANTTFNATASAYDNGTIAEFRWDFDGDGTVDRTTTEATANYTYSATGEYTASVTAVGGDGTNGTATASVTVVDNLPPKSGFLTFDCNRGFSTYCENWVGDSVRFVAQDYEDPDGSIVEFRWDFDGDGLVEKTTQRRFASYTFTETGSYTAEVTLVDNAGATNSTTNTARIDPRKTGTVSGNVTNATSGQPVEGVTVNAYTTQAFSNKNAEFKNWTKTDENGYYEFSLEAVEHNITVDPVGYGPASQVVTVEDNKTSTADFGLTPSGSEDSRGTGFIEVYVYASEGSISEATVEISNRTDVIANRSGFTGYNFSLPADSYDVIVKSSGYETVRIPVRITANETVYKYPTLDSNSSSANFTVDITGTNSPVEEGEDLNVTANVTNTGDEQDTQMVSLTAGALGSNSTGVTLGGGRSENVTLSVGTGAGDAGEYTATVSSDNDSDSASVNVTDGGAIPPEFVVNITGTNSPINETETLAVNATVENSGTLAGTQEINLTVENTTVGNVTSTAGEVKDTVRKTLNGGESVNVTLNWNTRQGDNGSYKATVSSENSADSRAVSVESDNQSFPGPIIEKPGFKPPRNIPSDEGGFNDSLVEDLNGDGNPTDIAPTVSVFGELIRGNDLGLTDTQARKLNWNSGSPETEVTVADMVTLFGKQIRAD